MKLIVLAALFSILLCSAVEKMATPSTFLIARLKVSFAQTRYSSYQYFLPRISMIPSDYHFQFKRLQFPVKVCFAMTINKAQGQSLKVAGVDLRNDCFSHGQLYVACSRVSSPDSLVILQPEGCTKNVVYKEVLSNKT